MSPARSAPGEAAVIRLVVTFLAGLLVFSAVFLLLDYAVMSAQGLSLIFHG